MSRIPFSNVRHPRSLLHFHCREMLSRGHWEKGVAVLAQELTCQSTATCCYGTKEPLGEARREEKPGGEWVSSSSTEKKTLVYSPWPLCHPWILFTPREVFSLIEPPRHGLPFLPRTLATFTGTLLVFCDLPHPFISPPFPFIYGLNQGRCSPSIANWLRRWTFITWWLEVCMVEMWEWGNALGSNAGSSSGWSSRSHTLSVTQGTTSVHVSQRIW